MQYLLPVEYLFLPDPPGAAWRRGLIPRGWCLASTAEDNDGLFQAQLLLFVPALLPTHGCCRHVMSSWTKQLPGKQLGGGGGCEGVSREEQ